MEKIHFDQIRDNLCQGDSQIQAGKMMSSEAIVYKQKVFAFFSRNHQMVFKLGKNYIPQDEHSEIHVFSPFKNKRPLTGWFEVPYELKDLWLSMAIQALEKIKAE
ncbi:MAG: hypothetical protein JXQ90_08495 [Cyclobacteriaceae bacterium]